MMLTKLKAGSLQLVTFIVVVIALLLSSFILLIHTHKLYRIKTNHITETVKLADQGIRYAFNNPIKVNDSVSVNVFDKDYKELLVHKNYWGTFEKIYSKASIKNSKLYKIALVGNLQPKEKPPALYVNDNNMPLVLVGHTKITGNAYLPARGVKSGNVSGQSYYNDNYIYGPTSISKAIPDIDQNFNEHLEKLYNGTFLESHIPLDLKSSGIYKNSFENKLKLAFSNSEIYLSDLTLIGHIIIQSKTKIVVDSSSKLQDVILIAPRIEIKQNVRGTFQAFATEQILVGSNVNLDYPSALVLDKDYNSETNKEFNRIEINDNTSIKGNIIALGKTDSKNYSSQINIASKTIVYGIVYCQQNLELRGTVFGSVYTDRFIVKEEGSIYQNHLFNTTIDVTELPSEYVGLLFENQNKSVAKWLY